MPGAQPILYCIYIYIHIYISIYIPYMDVDKWMQIYLKLDLEVWKGSLCNDWWFQSHLRLMISRGLFRQESKSWELRTLESFCEFFWVTYSYIFRIFIESLEIFLRLSGELQLFNSTSLGRILSFWQRSWEFKWQVLMPNERLGGVRRFSHWKWSTHVHTWTCHMQWNQLSQLGWSLNKHGSWCSTC